MCSILGENKIGIVKQTF